MKKKKIELSTVIVSLIVFFVIASIVFIAGLLIGQNRDSSYSSKSDKLTVELVNNNHFGFFNYEITTSAIASLLSVLVALIGIWITTNRSRAKTANRDTYIKLELASIELFRFEAQNIDITTPLWEGKNEPKPGSAKENAYFNYICQNLNLIEMAITFANDGVIDEEEFITWLIWIYDLCSAPGFLKQWERAKYNFSEDLKELVEIALGLGDKNDELRKFKFYSDCSRKYPKAINYYKSISSN